MQGNGSQDWGISTHLLRWQIGALVVIVGTTLLAPRQDAATLLVPLAGNTDGTILKQEIRRGAAIAGSGPAGGTVLFNTQQGIGWRALQSGLLAIRIPADLCSNTEIANGRSR